MESVHLWLECFFDLFKMLIGFIVVCTVYAAGYKKREADERRYKTPKRQARRRYR